MSSTSTVPIGEPVPPPSGTRLSCRLQVSTAPGGPVTVLSMAGELDISTQAHAATALDTALRQARGPLVVELSALTFCSAAGLGLLGGPAVTGGGHGYALAGLSVHLSRAAAVLWPADVPARYRDIASAVDVLAVAAAARHAETAAG